MCITNLDSVSTTDLIEELKKRNLLTKSRTNETISKDIDNLENFGVILTKGIPVEDMECRECLQILNPSFFTYYWGRIDQNGYLMRRNALCRDCAIESNKQRSDVLNNAVIPKKPKKGDECIGCRRSWSGKWHRHHEKDKFISWLCGHCNMTRSDQRIK
jgi:hypothetical protein